MLTLAERCGLIELLVLDVDGVLTDGGIIYVGNAEEIKAFHVRDGSSLKLWNRLGKQSAIITGRDSEIVKRRAAELDIAQIVQGATDKFASLKSLWAKMGIRPDQTAAIGDDLPDLEVLANVGLAVAVADACPEVRNAAHAITRAPGGRGAVRELIELVMKCQGLWRGAVETAG